MLFREYPNLAALPIRQKASPKPRDPDALPKTAPGLGRQASGRTIKKPKKEVNEGPVTLDKLMKECSGLLKEVSEPRQALKKMRRRATTKLPFRSAQLQTMDVNQIFTEPVDAVAFNLQDYHSIVKMPMDFRSIRQRVTYTEMEHDEFAKVSELKRSKPNATQRNATQRKATQRNAT